MKTKDLLFKLSDLESLLDSYSFEELKVTDAAQLKKSFQHFKCQLQEKILVVPASIKKCNATIYENRVVKHPTPLNGGVGALLKESLNEFNEILCFMKEDVTTRSQLAQVTEIQNTSNVLLGSVDVLLAGNSPKNEPHPCEESEFNLCELISNTKFLSENLIVRERLKIVAHGSKDLPRSVIGNMTRVLQILLHMLGQALQYAESGEVYLQIAPKRIALDTVLLEFQIDNLSCDFNGTQRSSRSHKMNQDYDINKIIKRLITDLGGYIDQFNHGTAGTIFKFEIPFKKNGKNKEIR